MWIVLAMLALSFVSPQGRVERAVRVTLFAALAWWGVDEAVRGVNPWRRILGVGTLAGMIVWIAIGVLPNT